MPVDRRERDTMGEVHLTTRERELLDALSDQNERIAELEAAMRDIRSLADADNLGYIGRIADRALGE